MVGHAAINIAKSNTTYWFNDANYVIFNWTPGGTDQSVSWGSNPLSNWASLRASGFTRIDAILPIPGHNNRAYFFSGSQFVCIELVPGISNVMIGSVQTITDGWPSLAKVGFDHVDAVCLIPGFSGRAYIFSGDMFCHVAFAEGQKSTLLYGPRSITEEWGETTFSSFDMIIPRPGTTHGLYMFSGDKYVELEYVHSDVNTIIKGPSDVATDWPVLHEAGFY